MIKTILTLLLTPFIIFSLVAQDTFSIVALDTANGEVGSAGASCIDGVFRISDVHPGIGAVHTQAASNAANKENARVLMAAGYSPQYIMDWLVANDVQGTPGTRQYGAVHFDSLGSPLSSAFTGSDAMDWKGHILGPNYAIQGNILAGQHVLDSMELRFVNTTGSLTEKLMAAMQGANFPGADVRCLPNGTSTLSAFIRVAKATDTIGDFYLDINVDETPPGKEPIDSLQLLFNFWKGECGELTAGFQMVSDSIYLTPFGASVEITNQSKNWAEISWDMGDGTIIDPSDKTFSYTYMAAGTYSITLSISNFDCNETATATVDVIEGQSNGILTYSRNSLVKVIPNPFSGTARLVFSAGFEASDQIAVFNMIGGEVMRIDGVHSEYVEITDHRLSGGVYTYTLTRDGAVIDVGKLVVQ